MTRRVRSLALTAAFALLAVPGWAASTYTVDPAHSEVSFQIRHLVTKVRGTFGKFDGTIVKDDANASASSVEFQVDAASIDTGIADRDTHLRSADFLDAEQYPSLSFQSKRVERLGGDHLRVVGDLTIRGVTRDVALDAVAEGRAMDPWGNERVGFSARTTINRQDFGLNWNQALEAGGLLVSNEVRISLEVEAVKQA